MTYFERNGEATTAIKEEKSVESSNDIESNSINVKHYEEKIEALEKQFQEFKEMKKFIEDNNTKKLENLTKERNESDEQVLKLKETV